MDPDAWEFPPDFTLPAYLEIARTLEYSKLAFRGKALSYEEMESLERALRGEQTITPLGDLRFVQCLFQVFDRIGGRLLEAKATPTQRSDHESDVPIELLDRILQILNTPVSPNIDPHAELGLPEKVRLFDVWLKERFIEEHLRLLNARVERWKDVRVTQTDRALSPRTRTYLGEATRAYIEGLDRATVVLCRAALESALKTRLEAAGVVHATGSGLFTVIEQARRLRILRDDDGTLQAATTVRIRGNDGAHPNTAVSRNGARECLDLVSTIIEGLFSE